MTRVLRETLVPSELGSDACALTKNQIKSFSSPLALRCCPPPVVLSCRANAPHTQGVAAAEGAVYSFSRSRRTWALSSLKAHMSVSDCVPAGTGYTMVVRVVEHIAMAESCRGGERLRMAEILVGDATGTIIVQAKNGAFPALMIYV